MDQEADISLSGLAPEQTRTGSKDKGEMYSQVKQRPRLSGRDGAEWNVVPVSLSSPAEIIVEGAAQHLQVGFPRGSRPLAQGCRDTAFAVSRAATCDDE